MADLINQYEAFQGLLVPDPRLQTLDEAESTYTEAEPVVGDAVPQADTELELVPSGSQASGARARVRALKAGMPGNTDEAGGFGWFTATSPEVRGWDAPTLLSGWEPLDWTTGVGFGKPDHPHAVRIDAAGSVAVINGKDGAVNDSVVVRVWDGETQSWGSEVTVHTYNGTLPTQFQSSPCMVPLPSGRLVALYWVPLDSGDAQVQMSYSDDRVTWTVGARYVLPAPLTYAAAGGSQYTYSQFKRLRAAYNRGEISLFAAVRESANAGIGNDAVRDVLIQYASDDLGSSLKFVSRSTYWDANDDLCGAYQDVVPFQDGFLFCYAHADPPDDPAGWSTDPNYEQTARLTPIAVMLGSAFQAWTEQDLTEVHAYDACSLTANSGTDADGSYIDDGDLALVVDDAGVAYLLTRIPQGQYTAGALNIWGPLNRCIVARSFDGETWEVMGQSEADTFSGTWWNHADLPWSGTGSVSATGTYPRNFTAAFSQGTFFVPTQHESAGLATDRSLTVMYLGGYTNVTAPAYQEAGLDMAARVGWSWTWLPFDLPDTGIYALTTTGGTAAIVSGELQVDTTGASLFYQYNPPGTVAKGVEEVFDVTVASGSVAADNVVARLRVADGVEEYEVKLRLGTASVVVIDSHGAAGAGSTIGTITADLTAGLEVKVAVQGSTVKIWHRAAGFDPDRLWTAGPTTSTLTDAASYTTAAADHRVRWGHASGSTGSSRWRRFCFVSNSWTGIGSTVQQLPTDLSPRPYAAVPVYVDGGLLIRAADGPALIGDEHHIDARSAYAIERCFSWIEASPQVTWQGEGDDPTVPVAQTVLTFALDQALTVASRAGNVMIGVGFFNTNLRTGALRARASGGSYSSLTTFDAAQSMANMSYTRSGHSVVGSGGSADNPYLHMMESEGWQVDLGSNVLRRVAWNPEGQWTGAGKLTQLILEGCDNTEPTSGTLALIPKDFIVLHRLTSGLDMRALQVVLDSQYTATGYPRIGTLVLGFAVVHGRRLGWTRVWEIEPDDELFLSRDGVGRVREGGPPPRSWVYGFPDPADLTRVMGPAPAPDHITSSTSGGALAVATVQDTPLQVGGLLRLLNGRGRGAVVLPNIPKGPPDTNVINRGHEHLLSRLVSSVRVESFLGEPGRSEVVRVSQMRFEEVR